MEVVNKWSWKEINMDKMKDDHGFRVIWRLSMNLVKGDHGMKWS